MSTPEDPSNQHVAEAFVSELQHWRDVAGINLQALSEQIHVPVQEIARIEDGTVGPSAEFARRADGALAAGGAIWRRWKEYNLQARLLPPGARTRSSPAVESVPFPATGLSVEEDFAELTYSGGFYHAVQRRVLRNIGDQPVSRYLIRISVDKFPGNPLRSNEWCRAHPLTWDELSLVATCEERRMMWRVKHDRDAFKEVWLLFANERQQFPFYPGNTTTIEYQYKVGDDKWGPWFQRAVRLPTKRLDVRLVFPTGFSPQVWGTETAMTVEPHPLPTAITESTKGDNSIFSWGTDEPILHARYRLEWTLTEPAGGRIEIAPRTPEKKMASIGVVQEPDPLLHVPAKEFRLPEERAEADRAINKLSAVIERAREIHEFAKGLGVAAPQINISRSVAVILPRSGERVILINPQIVEESSESDSRYEGCWSFFGVRGRVTRPLKIKVAHLGLGGQQLITEFEQDVARLVYHEVDHLYGVLYTDRMQDADQLIPVTQYSGTGQSWGYNARNA